jgi:hypothetical protein
LEAASVASYNGWSSRVAPTGSALGLKFSLFVRDFCRAGFYFQNMLLWLIALFILACCGIVAYYQGALRATISLVGLLFALLLAGPVGKLINAILPALGLGHPALLAVLGPAIAFVLILVAFKAAAVVVHRKVDAYYKYKASDTQRLLFGRMNMRVGVPVGLCNGVIYFFILCTAVYTLGYGTFQLATSEQDSWAMRVVNRLSEDMKGTGMAKAAAPMMPEKEMYYDACDILASIYHQPLLQNRLANYPPFLTLAERPEFKPITDQKFQEEWQRGMSLSEFMKNEKVNPLLNNRELFTNVVGLLGGDLKDLKAYLDTGKSPKYDDERILGRWEIDARESVARARRLKPNMGSVELRRLRTLLGTAFKDSTLTTTIDNRAILKLPALKDKGTQQGSWKSSDGRYILRFKETGDLEILLDGKNLIFTNKDGTTLVFENARV